VRRHIEKVRLCAVPPRPALDMRTAHGSRRRVDPKVHEADAATRAPSTSFPDQGDLEPPRPSADAHVSDREHLPPSSG